MVRKSCHPRLFLQSGRILVSHHNSFISKIALTHREALYIKAAGEATKEAKKASRKAQKAAKKGEEAASEAHINETIIKARENDIEDLKEDHQAAVKQLKEQLAEANEKIKSRDQRLKQGVDSKKRVQEKLQESQGRVEQLKIDLEVQRKNAVHLHQQWKRTGLDLGAMMALNTMYRASLEGGDPAVTALFDGHIQRKEAEITRLECELRSRIMEITDEKKQHEIDQAQAKAHIKGLVQDRDDHATTARYLSQSRNELQEEMSRIAPGLQVGPLSG